MEVKVFEVRDRMTFVPVIAIRLSSRSPHERFLLRRAGYAEPFGDYVLVSKMSGDENTLTCDPHCHQFGRSVKEAHRFLLSNWDQIESGSVVDVEYILGEVDKPKESEMFDVGQYVMGPPVKGI